MELAASWVAIVGTILIGIAATIWWGNGNKTKAIWVCAFPGVTMLMLAFSIQIQKTIWDSQARAKNSNIAKQAVVIARPSVTIAAIGFPDVVLKAGPVIIKWDIKNSIIGPQISIVEANMTAWFATSRNPLPDVPAYSPTPHKLVGVTIGPNDTSQATFRATRGLTQSDVEWIANGAVKFYVFGYIKYKGAADAEYVKGFIALYKPGNSPQYGMFDHYEQPNYNYDK
jgi:hypothetical protein